MSPDPFAAQRASHRLSCGDYMQAKRTVDSLKATMPFVWVEALPMDDAQRQAMHRPSAGVGYSVHASAHERDVPPFSIERYDNGRLSNYEADRTQIHAFAQMTEADRLAALRAVAARDNLVDAPAAGKTLGLRA